MVRTEAQVLAATWKGRSTFVCVRCDFMGIPYAATAVATCEEGDEYSVAAGFQIAWGKATGKIAKQIYERYGHLTPAAADIARWGRSYASQSQVVWKEYNKQCPHRVQQAADDWEAMCVKEDSQGGEDESDDTLEHIHNLANLALASLLEPLGKYGLVNARWYLGHILTRCQPIQ